MVISHSLTRLDIVKTFFQNAKYKPSEETYYMQAFCLTAYKCFKEICENNSLTYWAYGGTLIGSVRHNGFVPWDDDIDLMMPREDIRRLINLVKNDSKIHIEEHTTNVKYMRFYKFKVSDLGFVDLMPVDYYNCEYDEEQLRKNYVCQYNQKISSFSEIYDLINSDQKKNFFDKLAVIPKLYHGSRKYISIGLDGAHGRNSGLNSIAIEEIFPLSKVSFEDTCMYIPKNYDKYLTLQFEDYLTPVYFVFRHESDISSLRKDYQKMFNSNETIQFSKDPAHTYNDLMTSYVSYLQDIDSKDSRFLLSELVFNGLGTNKSSSQALELIEKDFIDNPNTEYVGKYYRYYTQCAKKDNKRPNVILNMDLKDIQLVYYQAKCYLGGIGCKKNYKKARELLYEIKDINSEYAMEYINACIKCKEISNSVFEQCRFLSDNGFTRATYLLATMLSGTFEDYADSMYASDLYERTLKKGYIPSLAPLYKLLWSFEQPLYDQRLFELASRYSVKNEGNSLYWLSRAYYTGRGTSQDVSKAITLMKKAFELNNKLLEEYCIILLKTKKANYCSEAVELYEKSKGTDPTIYGYIGRCYYKGIGVSIDLEKSKEYLFRAYSYKKKWFNEYCDAVFKCGSDEEIQYVVKLCEEYSSKNSGAMARLGIAYRDGKGVAKDLEKAKHYLSLASSKDKKWIKIYETLAE